MKAGTWVGTELLRALSGFIRSMVINLAVAAVYRVDLRPRWQVGEICVQCIVGWMRKELCNKST